MWWWCLYRCTISSSDVLAFACFIYHNLLYILRLQLRSMILFLLHINFFCREGDSFDMRKKLPFCVGLLLRLLKKNHKVYVTCTTGFDRSPACVVAYLHWMTDTSLHAAYNFVTGLHLCKPDRFFSQFSYLQFHSWLLDWISTCMHITLPRT